MSSIFISLCRPPLVDRERDIVNGGIYATSTDNRATSGFELQCYPTTHIELTASRSRSGDYSARMVRPGCCRSIGRSRSNEVPTSYILATSVQEYHLNKHNTARPCQRSIQVE